MKSHHNAKLTTYAKTLRKNMTKEERHLWYDFLRTLNIRFLRQKVIGNYVADFYSSELKIVIELDGSQHFLEKAENYDLKRTEFFNSLGIKVMRFSNVDIS